MQENKVKLFSPMGEVENATPICENLDAPSGVIVLTSHLLRLYSHRNNFISITYLITLLHSNFSTK